MYIIVASKHNKIDVCKIQFKLTGKFGLLRLYKKKTCSFGKSFDSIAIK